MARRHAIALGAGVLVAGSGLGLALLGTESEPTLGLPSQPDPGGPSDQTTTGLGVATLVIGPDGGRVEHVEGASLEIPPGALEEPVEIALGTGQPVDSTPGQALAGRPFKLGPSDQQFRDFVQVTLPHEASPSRRQHLRVAHRDDETGEVVVHAPVEVTDDHVTVLVRHFSTVQPVYADPQDPLLYADGTVAVCPHPSMGPVATKTFTFDNPGPAGTYVVGGNARLSLWTGTSWVGSAQLTASINGTQVLASEAEYLGGADPAALVAPEHWGAPVAEEVDGREHLATYAQFGQPVGGGTIGAPTVWLDHGRNQVTLDLRGSWSETWEAGETPWWGARVHLFGVAPGLVTVALNAPDSVSCGEPEGVFVARGTPGGGAFTWTVSGAGTFGGVVHRSDAAGLSREDVRVLLGNHSHGEIDVTVTYTANGVTVRDSRSTSIVHPLDRLSIEDLDRSDDKEVERRAGGAYLAHDDQSVLLAPVTDADEGDFFWTIEPTSGGASELALEEPPPGSPAGSKLVRLPRMHLTRYHVTLTQVHPHCGAATVAADLHVLRSPRRRPARAGSANVQEPAGGDGDSDALEKVGPCSVLLHNGENRHDRVDLFLPGRGQVHFAFRRRYRSRIRYDGPLGYGWDFDYGESLIVEEDGDVVRVNGRSRVDTWTRNADGTFAAPPGFFGALVQREDGSFVLREPDGFKRSYSAEGFLVRHEDRHGNRMLFERDDAGRLDRVIDAYDRVIDFTHEGGRLTRITDFRGREVIYSYDAAGDLVAVRSPVVAGTSTGNDFPEGRTERYVYSSGFAEEDLNHNLLAIVRPEEVASGGPAYLSWTYGTDPADPLSFDRVLTQTHGGTNASGVPAGGVISFSYAALQPAGPAPQAHSVTTVTDRNGNVTEHYFNERAEHVRQRQLTRGLRPDEPAAYETVSFYDQDHQLVRRILPAGNEVRLTHDRSGPRAAAGNVIEVRRVAGPRGGGEDLVTTLAYEPLFQRVRRVTGPRGNALGFVPPLGAASAARYTTTTTFDYQEGSGPVPEAETFGIDLSSVPRGLGDLNGDGRADQVAGDVVRVEAPTVQLLPHAHEAARRGDTSQEVVSELVWNDRGQILSATGPEGDVDVYEYYPASDPDGDGLLVASPLGPPSAEPSGYLRRVVRDAGLSPRRTASAEPARLETVLGYDPVGNVTSVRNPRGVVTDIEVNALNEPVAIVRGADVAHARATGQLLTDEQPLRYLTRLIYDHNGRVVRVETENRGGTTPGVGAFVDQTFAYDLLGNLVEQTAEIDGHTVATTQLRYDPNENLRRVVRPEGNAVEVVHDERDLPLLVTRGAGTPEAATWRLDYDLNGNRARLTDAEDNDGDGLPESTRFTHDGFDRLVRVTDALGGETVFEHDVAGNVVRLQVFGHPAARPGEPNVLLRDVRFHHDELSRTYQVDEALFLAPGFTPARPVDLRDHDQDGMVTTRQEYDALSRPTFVVEDDLEVSRTVWDGAGRPVLVVDQLGNQVSTAFDAGSNPVSVTSLEVSPEGLVPDEAFTTRYVWDQLDRLVRATDNVGQTTRFSYDSRDNLVGRSDAVGPAVPDPLGLFPGPINAPGNTTTYVVDGLDRVVRTLYDLRQEGQGGRPLELSNPANPDGRVELAYVWDRNGRLTAIVDDRFQRTSLVYDALDRRVRRVNADGEAYTYTFDRDDNLRQVVDPNQSVATRTHDALHRLVRVDVQRGPGVGGTTLETFAYDGANRLVRATDDNGAPTATQVTEYVYDSLSRVLEEVQNGHVVSSVWSGDGKRSSTTYPGGRRLERTFDGIDRVRALSDASGFVSESYWIGPGYRELLRQNGNGTALSLLDDTATQDLGYDAARRLVRLRWFLPDGRTSFLDREYGYNRADVRVFERRNEEGGATDRFTYDSLYRIVESAYDQAPGGSAVAMRDVVGARYRLDGVGNRVEVEETRRGSSLAVLAREKVTLGPQSVVLGDVVANDPGGHPRPGAGRGGRHPRHDGSWREKREDGRGGDRGDPRRARDDDEDERRWDQGRGRQHERARRGHGERPGDRGERRGRGREDREERDRDEDRGRRGHGSPGVELQPFALVRGDVTGHLVTLGPGARIEGDVRANFLNRAPGSSITGGVAPATLPATTLPEATPVQAGTQDFCGRPHQQVLLQPGSYGRISVGARGALVLPAGDYALEGLRVDHDATIVVQGPVTLRVVRELDLGNGVRVLAEDGLRTEQVRWETAGGRVTLGHAARLFGTLVAPATRVKGHGVSVRGQLVAERIDLGPRAEIVSPAALGEVAVEARAYTVNDMNEYTAVGGVARVHGDNGNLIDDGRLAFLYDYKNRLVGVTDRSTGQRVAQYLYYADGRRAEKRVFDSAGGAAVVTALFYDGQRVCEERDAGSGLVTATYVWSPVYVDELVEYQRTAAHPLGAGSFFVHQDARADVVAVTDASGAVVERRFYDDFGRALGVDKAPFVESAVGLVYGFQGRRLDAETGLMYFRARYYSPETGRFLQRDPVWDAGNVGGWYTFVGNGPWSRRDPSGRDWRDFFGVGQRESTALSFVTGYYTGLYETAKEGWQSAQREATENAYLFYMRGDSDLEAALGTAGVLFTQETGTFDLYEAGAGYDLREFSRSGNYDCLSTGERIQRGAIGTFKLATSAAGGASSLSRGRAALGGARARAPTPPSTCFLKGALVMTSGGARPVEEVETGEKVLSRDERTGDQGYQEVVRTYRGWTDRVVYVQIARAEAVQRGRGERHRVGADSGGSGEDGGGVEADEPPSAPNGEEDADEQTLRCSPPHPFWVVGRGWVRAEHLRVGDPLSGSSGEALVVVGHEVRAERAEVFNVHVAEWRTYFVAARGDGPFVWVHNKDGLRTGARTGSASEGAQGGSGLGRLEGREIGVTEQGIARVEQHLAQFGEVPENAAMIARLRAAAAEGRNLTGADASFYLHELREAHLMGRGLPYEQAHPAALQRYGVSPFSVYHPQVIESLPSHFNQNWRAFWGLGN